MGCSKCRYWFTSCDWGLDYSRYERQEWEPRILQDDISNAHDQRKHCWDATNQDAVISEHGVWYSVLINLPYLHVVCHHIIDPMHNLMLGTAKHVTEVWKNKFIKSLETVEECALCIKSPYDVGQLPSIWISGFTADQWLNWTLVFSVVTLKGIIPTLDLQCWQLFVRACSILCSKLIWDVDSADQYLVMLCTKFLGLYGPESCTPNMHLHLHLTNCVLDYAPVYSFWLFGFERFNGILGAYNTNNRNIEVQIMRVFATPTVNKNGNTLWLSSVHHYSQYIKCGITSSDNVWWKGFNPLYAKNWNGHFHEWRN